MTAGQTMRFATAALASVAAVLAVAPLPTYAESPASPWIVVLKDTVPSPKAVATEQAAPYRAKVGHIYDVTASGAALKGYAIEATAAQIRAIRSDLRVESVEPDRMVRLDPQKVKPATGTPKLAPPSAPVTSWPSGVPYEGDPLRREQWGLFRIGASTAVAVPAAAKVGVALLDTGVDRKHPELRVAGAVNFSNSPTADDRDGSGTFAAGVVQALNDGIGGVGVAPGTPIWSVKVLGDNGVGSFSDIVKGLEWVARNARAKNIRVANLGFVTDVDSVAVRKAIRLATAAGAVCVAPAGDAASSAKSYPAAYPQVIGVAAIDRDDFTAGFSNRSDSWVDVAAPGVEILSTRPGVGAGGVGRYRFESSTGAAAPFVSATVALCITAGHCRGTAEQVSDTVAVESSPSRGTGTDYRYGVVQAGPHYWTSGPTATTLLAPKPEPVLPTTAIPADSQAKSWIVLLKDDVAGPGAVAAQHAAPYGAKVGHVYNVEVDGAALKGYVIEAKASQVRAIAADPRVEAVEPNEVMRLDLPRTETRAATPARVKEPTSTRPWPGGVPYAGDPLRGEQYGLFRVGASGGDRVQSPASVGVAVVDSGVDLNHPDLRVSGAVNFTPSPTADDLFGHGTHIAGIVQALNNGIGVEGAAPGTELWSVKVLDNEGLSTPAWIAAGVEWVARNAKAKNIRVANMSLGGPPFLVMRKAIQVAIRAGVVVVASAGNGGSDLPLYPAGFPETVAVGATDQHDNLWSRSQRGPWVDLVAPGVDIWSTLPTHPNPIGPPNYGPATGTSMSTPFVAATVALCISSGRCRGTVAEIRSTVEHDSRPGNGTGISYRYGIVQASRYWQRASRAPRPTRPAPAIPTTTPNGLPVTGGDSSLPLLLAIAATAIAGGTALVLLSRARRSSRRVRR